MRSIANIGGSHTRIEVSQEGNQGFYSLLSYLSVHLHHSLLCKFLSYSRNKNIHSLAEKNEVSIPSFSNFVYVTCHHNIIYLVSDTSSQKCFASGFEI